jgi:hypothetical protein
MAYGAGTALWQFNMPVTPRVVPTGVTYTGTATNLRYYVGNSSGSVSSFAYNDSTIQTAWVSSGISGASNAQCIMLATPISESGVIYFTGCEL